MEMTWAIGTQGALAFSLVWRCLERFSIISLPAKFTSWLHKGSRARFLDCLSLCGSWGELAVRDPILEGTGEEGLLASEEGVAARL